MSEVLSLFSRVVRNLVVAALSLFIFGCSSFTAGNFFSHYSAQNQEMHEMLLQGDYADAQSSLNADGAGNILSNLERII
jgi:hypothetical protein